jgi:hypothetical protein
MKVQESGAGVVSTTEVQVFGTFRGNEWSNKGEVTPVKEMDGKTGAWGFEVKALGSKEYFVEKTGCMYPFPPLEPHKSPTLQLKILMCNANWRFAVSPLSLFKNPMILIAGLSMIIVFGMPYLMDNSKSTPLLVML